MEHGKELDGRVPQQPAVYIPPAAGGHVHIHHHYAPEPVDRAPVYQGPDRNALDKYLPAIVVAMLIIFTLGLLAVVGLLLTPLIMALTVSIQTLAISVASTLGMAAMLALAISAAVRNVRQQGKDAAKADSKKGKK